MHSNGTGYYASVGNTYRGSNVIDVHGPKPANSNPRGCAQIYCHQSGYMRPGYIPGAGTHDVACVSCHGLNTQEPARVPGDDFMWFSGQGLSMDNDIYLDLTATPLPANAYLEFQVKHDIESVYDYLYLYIYNGTTWTRLVGNISRYPSGKIDCSTNNQWVTARFDLSAYAGKSVVLDWWYHTDYMDSLNGVFVDDIYVGNGTTTVFSDDVETVKPQYMLDPPGGWTRVK
jgi:hypothetical protein